MKTNLQSMKRPELGDKCFEVEWCYDLPIIEGTTDCDIDAAKYAAKRVPTLEGAMQIAKQVYPLDKFGAVRITPMEYRDDVGDGIKALFDWEPSGDSIEYSGD